MNYVLRADDSSQRFAEATLPDNFAAERWARDWVRENAKQDRYVLERDGGGFAQTVFKTVGGQWYLTPRR